MSRTVVNKTASYISDKEPHFGDYDLNVAMINWTLGVSLMVLDIGITYLVIRCNCAVIGFCYVNLCIKISELSISVSIASPFVRKLFVV